MTAQQYDVVTPIWCRHGGGPPLSQRQPQTTSKRLNSHPTLLFMTWVILVSVVVLVEVVHAKDMSMWGRHSPNMLNRNPHSPLLRRHPPLSKKNLLVLHLRGGGSDGNGGGGSDHIMDTTAETTNPHNKKKKKKKKKSRGTQKRSTSKTTTTTTTPVVKEEDTTTTTTATDSSPPTDSNSNKPPPPRPEDPIIAQIECSILSIGCGMGATDTAIIMTTTSSPQLIRESSLSTLLQQYFLSHAGLYGLQSILSVLTLLAGAVVMVMTSSSSSSSRVLVVVKRTLLFAALKYTLGVGGGSPWISSRGISRIGLRNTRHRTIEPLIQSSNISQRLWYCLVMLGGWLPTLSSSEQQGGFPSLSTTSTLLRRLPRPLSSFLSIPVFVVAPVLLQELASLLLGCVDVLHIAVRKYSDYEEEEHSNSLLPFLVVTQRILQTSLCMWIGASLKMWNRYTPSLQQQLVARRTNQYATMAEFVVGVIMCVDVLQTMSHTLLGGGGDGGTSTRGVWTILQKLICTKLFVSYGLSKRNTFTNEQ
mmetsp:Transcript_7642/g.11571  ORF Transcript_7642/g.11571 Transcript_7642/m.11571 type:complete len:532 (+) Transcript_7642:218-1813(+)